MLAIAKAHWRVELTIFAISSSACTVTVTEGKGALKSLHRAFTSTLTEDPGTRFFKSDATSRCLRASADTAAAKETKSDKTFMATGTR